MLAATFLPGQHDRLPVGCRDRAGGDIGERLARVVVRSQCGQALLTDPADPIGLAYPVSSTTAPLSMSSRRPAPEWGRRWS